MERVGLVSQVEAELEKMLALGLLPRDGKFPSEHGLARCFGVSRGTVREAIRGLSTRGLIVPYPGRRTRVVPWDQALNLETLSVALTGDGRLMPGRHQLLEGFLALKREITVDLLVACCETASPAELDQLSQACFLLEDTARWDAGDGKWVWQEFDLLKQAACVADRLGHLLLIQSLERTFRGLAKWALPHLNPQAVQSWARCATLALDDKNVQALRHELPPLLKAVTERLMRSVTPPHEPPPPRDPTPTVEAPSPSEPSAKEPEWEGPPGPENPILSDNRAGLWEVAPTEASPPEPSWVPDSGSLGPGDGMRAELAGGEHREAQARGLPEPALDRPGGTERDAIGIEIAGSVEHAHHAGLDQRETPLGHEAEAGDDL